MRAVGRESLDGDDFVAGLDVTDLDRARSLHFAIDVNGTRSALRDATAILGAGEADPLTDRPQQRRLRWDLYVARFPVDVELGHAGLSRLALLAMSSLLLLQCDAVAMRLRRVAGRASISERGCACLRLPGVRTPE